MIDGNAFFFNCIQGNHQGMPGRDLIVAIRPDEKKIFRHFICNHQFHQFQGRRIRPLHIIQKNGQRMIRPAQCLNKILKDQVETVLRRKRPQFRHRRLWSDDQFHIRNHINDNLSIRTKGCQELLPPLINPGVTLGQDLTYQFLECLNYSFVRNIPMELVELA